MCYPLSTRYVHVSHDYNRALVTHARGWEYNLYANELSDENLRLPMVNADAVPSKKRQNLRPASRDEWPVGNKNGPPN